ncbi:MAG: hypothetical protein GY808_06330, partial [Gammaproteobacteria bacterium]|nr:hypothetical protein [Gammaproteobacteria bacterium]
MKSTIRLLIVTGVFLSSFVTLASTTWVPIGGDITIFIPYEPSEPFEAPVNIQKSENGGVSTLTWDDVEHASQFEVQGLNAQGVWVTILVTTDNFVVLDERFSDYSQIRIAACNYQAQACSNASSIIYIVTETAPTRGEPEQPPSPHVQTIPSIDKETNRFGALKGSFRVNESGAATYNIPIATVPGSGGVAPQMALNYNSQGGNGIAGKGWSLSGGSAITRCRQTWEQDGSENSKAITLTASDRLCLDGQRLILVSNHNYGANGSVYRTEINSFARITAHGNVGGFPSNFTVERKDGTTTEYGNTADSRVEANNNGSPISSVMSWAVNKITDSTNNYMTFSYTENTSSGEFLLDRVDYTGNTNVSPYAHIKFNYETRDDIKVGYAAGSKSSQLKRLTSVDSFSGSTLVRSYNLTYEPNPSSLVNTFAINTPSQLNQVEECSALNGSIVCREPTVFDWHLPGGIFPMKNWANSLVSNTDFSYQYDSSRPGDVNGDGKIDLVVLQNIAGQYCIKVYISDGTKFNSLTSNMICVTSSAKNSWELIDFNGDGRLDLIYPNSNTWIVHRGMEMNGGFEGHTSSINTGISSSNSDDVKFVDMNGDGLTDMLYIGYIQNPRTIRWMIPSSNTVYPYTFSDEIPVTFPLRENERININNNNSVIGDFNGDGHIDIAYFASYMIQDPMEEGPSEIGLKSEVLLSDGGLYSANFTPQSLVAIPSRAIDFNGDGLTDLVANGDNKVGIFISTGKGFKSRMDVTGLTNINYVQYADYDADGDVDILYPDNSGDYRVRKWIGTAFDTSSYPTNANTELSLEVDNFFMDVNGDGHLDHASIKKSSQKIRLANNPEYEPKQLIKSITSGSGHVTEIDYTALTDADSPDFYTKGTGANELLWGQKSRVFDVLAPIYAVSEARSSSPGYNTNNALLVDNMVAVQYEYEGLRIQAGGRGSLGFEKLRTIDPASNIVTETTYLQEYPYTGMPFTTIQTYGTCELSNSENKYGIKQAVSPGSQSNYVQQPYLLKSTETTHSYTSSNQCVKIGTTVTLNDAIDDHGNITTLVVTNKDNYDNEIALTTTESSYTNDTNNWFLGRLDTSTVTQTRPGESSVVRHVGFEYDLNTGLLTKEIVEPGGDPEYNLTTWYDYDNFGNKIRTSVCSSDVVCETGSGYDSDDPYSIYRTSQTIYDAMGRFPIQTINAYGQTTMQIPLNNWNALGQPTQVIDSMGVAKDISYTNFGMKYFERTPSIGTWERTQFALCDGSLSCEEGAIYRVAKTGGGKPLSYTYHDVLGRAIQTLVRNFEDSWDSNTTRYDLQGRLIWSTAPMKRGGSDYWTINTYDIFGRLEHVRHPDYSTSEIDYQGLSTITTNALGQTHTETKNALGDLVSVTDNLNNTTRYTYDAKGKLRTLTDSLNNPISVMTYDKLGRKISMDDADKGFWKYDYNAAGELIEQEDAKGQVTKNYYDMEGRLTNRQEYNDASQLKANAHWSYETLGTAPLLNYENDTKSGFRVEYYYDNVGRIYQKITTIDAIDYVEDTTFDQHNRPFQVFDVSGAGIQYAYNARGYLEKTMDAHDLNIIYSQVNAMGPYGNVTELTLENGAVTKKTYDPETGRLTNIMTTSNGLTVQNLSYIWDAAGNLKERTDNGWISSSSWKNLTETFHYDGLNRLDYNQINGVTEMDIGYNEIGNIMSKRNGSGGTDTKNYGAYTYGGTCNGIQAGPHAVTSAGSKNYCYDENGNMVKDKNGSTVNRTLAYTTFDKPSAITKGNNHTTSFAYGTGHGRYKRVDDNGSSIITKHYVGNVEIIGNSSTGQTSYKRYIGSSVIQAERAKGSITTEYVHQDHLGSLDAITYSNGTLKADVSFDAFGVRRNAAQWTTTVLVPSAILTTITDTTQHGFTNHEMLDEVDIIHMNG